MNIKEIKDKNIWENFLLDCEEKTFLQSWNWGEFQKNIGNKIWRFGIFEKNEIVSVAFVIKTQAKRGTFLFLPHTPVVKYQILNIKYQVLELLLKELKKIAKTERVNFIRISPIWQKNEENIKIFKNLGFRNAPIHMHAEITWELEILPPEVELLNQMRKTTRYLIKKSQKNKDIEVYQSKDLKDAEIFNELYQGVIKRHHFVPFSLEYLKKEFLAFYSDDQISIFCGKFKNEIISSGIFIFWQNIAFYHHGATSLKYPKIPISYLLLWEAIREAKRRGCQKFNFWGIAPEEKKSHPWAGLTLFKMGFGGYKKEYVKTQDFPLSFRYWPIYIFEKIRKTKRGL